MIDYPYYYGNGHGTYKPFMWFGAKNTKAISWQEFAEKENIGYAPDINIDGIEAANSFEKELTEQNCGPWNMTGMDSGVVASSLRRKNKSHFYTQPLEIPDNLVYLTEPEQEQEISQLQNMEKHPKLTSLGLSLIHI